MPETPILNGIGVNVSDSLNVLSNGTFTFLNNFLNMFSL